MGASALAEAVLDELMVIHLLYGLSNVLPAWVEARNNDLHAGNGTWTIDILIQSVEDHIRHVNEEPVKTFLMISKQKEEQQVLTQLNGQHTTVTATTVVHASPSINSATTPAPSTYKGRTPKPIGMCDHCNREHTGPNELCWIAHPELMPDSQRRKRAAWNASQATAAARTNVTTSTSTSAIHKQDTDDAKDDA
jgi:hypothetical protein